MQLKIPPMWRETYNSMLNTVAHMLTMYYFVYYIDYYCLFIKSNKRLIFVF